MSSKSIFPFMYRGRCNDADQATEVGYYEIFGVVSNFPFSQSWGPMLVYGEYYKVQIAAYSVSDGMRFFIRQIGNKIGWKEISLI